MGQIAAAACHTDTALISAAVIAGGAHPRPGPRSRSGVVMALLAGVLLADVTDRCCIRRFQPGWSRGAGSADSCGGPTLDALMFVTVVMPERPSAAPCPAGRPPRARSPTG